MAEIDLNYLVKMYSNTEFILLFVFIFFILSIVVSFVKFVSQWPVLVILSLVMAFFIYNAFSSQKDQDPYYQNSKTYLDNMIVENKKKLEEGMYLMQNKNKDAIGIESLLFQEPEPEVDPHESHAMGLA